MCASIGGEWEVRLWVSGRENSEQNRSKFFANFAQTLQKKIIEGSAQCVPPAHSLVGYIICTLTSRAIHLLPWLGCQTEVISNQAVPDQSNL